MIPQWIIEKKRDGKTLSEEEIISFISGYSEGSIPDYQMSALAMAIFLNGMTREEVAFLTDAMMNSGVTVDTSCLSAPTADKHSTGGIGDKVSLILAPLAASCGAAVPMLSGRGLGITGGTLDKLESIPGYRTDYSIDQFLKVIETCGCSIMGQTEDLAPADKKLYALRDVTGTVPSIPLITASIMSKKLAENASCLVFDVKWGKGAFMKTKDNARELAVSLIETGARMGRKTTALLTDMNQPLGRTAGNNLEVIESIEALQGNGPDDLMQVTLALTAHMLILTGLAENEDDAHDKMQAKIDSGEALETFRRMVELHEGDLHYIDNTKQFTSAKYIEEYTSDENGFVCDVDAEIIGRAGIVLGAGRLAVTDKIDPSVGFSDIVKTGKKVEKGDVLLKIHSNDDAKTEEVISMLKEAIVISTECPKQRELISDIIKPKEQI